MIFKARLGRVLAGAFGAILAFAMTGTAYADTTPGVDVVSAPSTITVHVYNNNNQISNVEGSGEEITDSSAAQGLGTAIKGATLSYYKVGELVQYTQDGSTSLKYAVKEEAVKSLGLNEPRVSSVTIGNDYYYLCDAAVLQDIIADKTSSGIRAEAQDPNTPIVKLEDTGTTDEKGAVSVGSLSGIYLFIGKSMPSHVTTEVVPFFVSAPMPADGSWNTDIHVYPKVQTADAITINKEVHYANDANNFVQSMSANSKTPLEYRITVTIPENVKNLGLLTVNDAIPTGLELVTGSVSVTTSDNVKLDSNDYTLSVADQIAFSLKGDEGIGLDKFDSVSDVATIYITYQAKISDSASLAAPIAGTATLEYAFDVSAGGSDTATATVYTYGIDLTKTFEGATAYPTNGNAQFSLYTDENCKTAVKIVGSNDGTYWVDSSSSTTAMDVAQFETTAGGTLTIKGLAEGTYYLKEVAAPDGYGKLQDPIKITIAKGSNDDLTYQIGNPTAKVNDVAATIDAAGTGTKAGLVQLTVENQKLLFGFLPKTGDVGTFIFIAAGIGLVCAAVVYLTSRRRKNISNSH